MVDMPSVPYRDPSSVVLADPQVPERKRHCGHCDHAVGRSHPGRSPRTEGFCPHCGRPYSFTPKLSTGERVGGQYQVAGCIAHGGLGWVYLAQDKNVSDRWVVLKGLLDTEDESAMAAAIAERRFLAEVEHPNIVKIYNFVEHRGAGYIVMEYVGGESLRELRNRHREEHGSPLPLAQSIAYILEILPAFGFLHRRGLLYCDFKPDNVIQTEEQVKLIDLGGVRNIDDQDSDLYGTIGYQAPEVPDLGASVASDLYTVARTLAVLSIDFAGFQDEKRYATSLPPTHVVPLFARYESFHHFLRKATAPDPEARFQSAGEMAEQLVGVLREVIAVDGGSPPPAASALFSAELGAAAEAGNWQDLPIPTVDPFDPAAGILATLAMAGPAQRQMILESAPRSPELVLGLVRSLIGEGEFAEAARELDSPEARASGWRAAWWRGIELLAEGRPSDARAFFGTVAGELPGELAPKLAIATCLEHEAESDAELHEAARYYELVAATDPSWAGASFGLSRVRLALADRVGAAAALERVLPSSSAHASAQVSLCRLRCLDLDGVPPTLDDLTAASDALARLQAEPSVRLPLLRGVQAQALAMLLDGRAGADGALMVGGALFVEDDQRVALERTYRSLAKLADSGDERCDLVDLANAVRPRTRT
jgi:serine/threonine-protein kinase PknG